MLRPDITLTYSVGWIDYKLGEVPSDLLKRAGILFNSTRKRVRIAPLTPWWSASAIEPIRLLASRKQILEQRTNWFAIWIYPTNYDRDAGFRTLTSDSLYLIDVFLDGLLPPSQAKP